MVPTLNCEHCRKPMDLYVLSTRGAEARITERGGNIFVSGKVRYVCNCRDDDGVTDLA
jgi:hypothetical protein